VMFVSVERSDGETLAHVITMGARGDVEMRGRRLARSMHDTDEPPTLIEKGQKP
jgi:hypothetical protein